ncbi:type I polyketide synthase [Neorhodopirellula pilleata]|uniref:Phenolphthiocerol synthesis polyketide synthase type I Pks15/1 n=1 Tax=Neorhodopirellula pilleata TaxID=2714738 RepID=A0A5C6AW83_9BACT|nr:type I polyketide synthase [Neorhodopirellula pilleata]TWU03336.1 Phenolphthiocerol synthesis polyketide synthase type I Pks15/1 [Neorhodopirellula pilleata]
MNDLSKPPRSTPRTLVELLRDRVDRRDDAVLYRFLKPRSDQPERRGKNAADFDIQTLSYVDLQRAAQRMAVWLLDRVAPGDRVVLAFPPGCEYLTAYFGCLHAGVVAVPAYPPRRNQRDQRLHAILADADVRVALTTQGLLESVQESMADAKQVQWHSIESVESSGVSDADWAEPQINSDTLAFLQYTSGSTGTPKGVMVTHGNLIHNQTLIQHSFRSTEDCNLTGWLPLHHDMGLIGNALHPLHLGSSLTFMSPIDFLQKPVRWLRAIDQFDGRVSGGPNFAYRLCVDEIDDSELEGLDLSAWKVAFNGAEPIDPNVLDRFAERFKPYGFSHQQFCPCYGMAETTLLVTSSVRDEAVRISTPDRWVGCGVPREDMDIRIVDGATLKEVSPAQTGEIWISGPSVAAGYWKRPDATRETFEATLEGSDRRYLRTGDLGWIDPKDGELYVTGRCKDLLIVRGVNHYPQDIERTSESAHDASATGGCAAFSITRDGTESLVIAQEVRRSARRTMNADEVVDAIRKAVVDEHQLPPISILLLRPGALPKTTSGKVQRSEARRQYLADEMRVEHRWDLFSNQAIDTPTTCSIRDDRSDRVENNLEASKLTEWLVRQVAQRVKLPAESIDPGEPFSMYGLDSPGAVRLAGELSLYLGREIPPTLAYEYPTINALVAFLCGVSPSSRSDLPKQSKQSKRSKRSDDCQSIAIIGIGCRFPMADSPDAFWDLLSSGQDAIRDAANVMRWSSSPSSLDAAYRRAGYLNQVDQFDAGFFGISPREADAIDPQHRLLLETTYEAFEDAGIPITHMQGRSVGVFVGSSHQDYLRLSNASSVTAYSASGNSLAMASGRISYTFDFRGPSLTIDTACSSSLVATHQAIRSIRNGECDYAIAAGVNLILSDEATESFAKAGMLSSTGVCRAFDDQANGFVRGEGVAAILLQPLDDAIADGNRIYGVLKGSAINQDGRTNGLTAPSREAQSELIREALHDGGLSPEDLDYVEAHGTGTPLGDPIELRAIREVIGSSTRLQVGSVKSNIGHLESAAGIAGLIKVALAMHHEQLPPQIHFERPNSNVAWDESITVPTRPTDWKRQVDRPRVAGVSSFGFSGTNAHVIVAEAPAATAKPETITRQGDPLVMSAKSEPALAQQIESIESLASQVDHTSLAFSLAVRRSHYRYRAAKIGDARDATWIHATAQRNPHVDFYFTGQGGIHPGWARSLHQSNPTFARLFDEAARSYQRVTGDDLKSRVWGDANGWSDVQIQPAIYTIQVATARFWQKLGIETHRVVGHSLGEYAAATIAGVFEFEDGLKLVDTRSRLAGAIQQRGGMLAVFASEADTQAALEEASQGRTEDWDIAVVNGPRQTLIAALPETLERLTVVLNDRGITTRPMATTHGFHSRLIDPMLDEFEAYAATIPMRPPTRPMISSQTGLPVGDEVATPAYWRGNLRNTVRFDSALKTLSADKAGKSDDTTIGLEIGAGSTLSGLARASKLGLDVLPGIIDHPDSGTNHGATLAKLYLHGAEIDWRLALGAPAPMISLPTYCFDRSRHWITPSSEEPASAPGLQISPPAVPYESHRGTDSPGTRLDLAGDDVVYQNVLMADDFIDHQVMSSIVFPAAGIFWWACRAGQEQAKSSIPTAPVVLENVRIERSLVLSPGESKTSQLSLKPGDANQRSGQWSVRHENGWQRHADWRVRSEDSVVQMPSMPLPATRIGQLQSQCVATHYRQLADAGLQYGPSYRCIEQIRATGKWVDAVIAPASPDDTDRIGLFDSALQTIAAAGYQWGSRTWVPVGAQRIEFASDVESNFSGRLHVQASLLEQDDESATAEIWISGESSDRVLIHIVGLKVQATTPIDTQHCLFQDTFVPRIRLTEPANRPTPKLNDVDWYIGMPEADHGVLTISNALEALAGRWVADILSELGLRWEIGRSFTTSEFSAQAGVLRAHGRLLHRILAIAAEERWLTRDAQRRDDADHDSDETRWTIQAVPTSTVAEMPRIAGQNEFVLLDRCAASVAEIMRTGKDPLPLLFPSDGQATVAHVYRDSIGGRRLNHLAATSVQRMVDALPPGRGMRILEIGAGTGSTTASVLPCLPPDRCRYDFTDIAPGFFIAAKEQFQEFGFVNYQVLNIENDPATQGFDSRLGTYDLVIAANVLHATADMTTTLQNIARMLSPRGSLIVLEGTRPARWMDLTFGLTDGWWRFTDADVRADYPLLSCDGWRSLLSNTGFEGTCFIDPVDNEKQPSPSHLICSHRQQDKNQPESRVGFVGIGTGDCQRQLIQQLNEHHSDAIAMIDAVEFTRPAVTSSDRIVEQVQAVCDRSRPTHWVLMLEIDDTAFDSPADGLMVVSRCVLDTLQTIENWSESLPSGRPDMQIDWVTRRCDSSMISDALSGFWRTATLEHPQWRCRSIDVAVDGDSNDALAMLCDELVGTAADRSEVRLDIHGRRVRELTRIDLPIRISDKVGRELSIRRRGSLDGLTIKAKPRRKPQTGEIEIRIRYAGLNFRDVLNVLGSYPGNPPLGAECVGVVASVGEGIDEFAVGDHVVAITPDTLADFVTLPVDSVCPIGEGIDEVGLASLPVAFLTASESLESIAQLSAGQSVLIHSAAGGVGMAAVQIARSLGANVYATASRSKHDFLIAGGLEHVFDSRDLGYADAILSLTGGRGVDVVLNSLGEDFVDENLRCLAPQGRYVDIALSNETLTRRIQSNRPDIHYSTLDLSQTLASHPGSIRCRLEDLLKRIADQEIHPLPSRLFTLDHAEEAFAWMMEGLNVGKPIVRCDDVSEQSATAPSSGVHLISGGLGGLGLLTCDVLVRRGVHDIVLLTRREPTDREATILQDWNRAGARVRVEVLAIDQLDSVESTLDRIRSEGRPITAVYHLAGVLQDSVISEQSTELFQTVLDPKAKGGWNLHRATLDDPIDSFVLFSSMSGWLGSPGQANHATANAFLDALADHRRRAGLPAVSIGWGPWARVGSAAKRDRLGKGDLAGIGMLMPDEGAELLEQILGATQGDVAHQLTVPARIAAGKLLIEQLPEHLKADPLFAGLSERTELFRSFREEKLCWIGNFSDYSQEEQAERVMNHLTEAIAGALAMPSAESVPIDSPLFDLGMDSLTSLELVNHLQSTLGVRMSTVELFNFPDVRSLAGRLVELLNDPSDNSRPLAEAFEDVPLKMNEIQADSVADGVDRDEVTDLLREIGDLTDQFETWGAES